MFSWNLSSKELKMAWASGCHCQVNLRIEMFCISTTSLFTLKIFIYIKCISDITPENLKRMVGKHLNYLWNWMSSVSECDKFGFGCQNLERKQSRFRLDIFFCTVIVIENHVTENCMYNFTIVCSMLQLFVVGWSEDALEI